MKTGRRKTILCIKCSIKQILFLKSKNYNLIYLYNSWDKDNVLFLKSDVLFRKRYFIESFDSIEDLSKIYFDIINDYPDLYAILNGAEYGIFASGYLKALLFNDTLHLKNAIYTRNKKAMKSLFLNAGILNAKSYGTYNAQELLHNKLKNVVFPIVAKPISGTASFNTEIIESNEDLKVYARELNFHPAIVSKYIILEQYIQGAEYHVDIIWSAGEISFISIGKYFVPRVDLQKDDKRRLNGTILIEKIGNEKLYNDLVSMHLELNKQLMLNNCVTHTEFFMLDNQIVFSEIATRFGGGMIPEMIFAKYHVDIELYYLKCQLDMKMNSIVVKESKYVYGALNFIPLQSGTITKIPDLNEIRSLKWISHVESFLEIDMKITFEHPSEWCLLLVIEGESEEDILKKIEYLYDNYAIEVS